MKTTLNEKNQGLVVYKSPVCISTPSDNIGIDQITIDDQFTTIDFVYIVPQKHQYGAWIQIDGDAYIRPFGSSERYSLIKALHISIAPAKHYFEYPGQVHHFSLVFPALPKEVRQFDFIEKKVKGSYFNFFNIMLEQEAFSFINTNQNQLLC